MSRGTRRYLLAVAAVLAAGAASRAQESAQSFGAEKLTRCTPELKAEYKALDRQLIDGCFDPAGVEAVCTPGFLAGVVGFMEKIECASYTAVVTECADSLDPVRVESYVNCETGLSIISQENCMSFWLLKRFCE